MTWSDYIYRGYLTYFERLNQQYRDYILNMQKLNESYNESIKLNNKKKYFSVTKFLFRDQH
jgi:hypothetical protein